MKNSASLSVVTWNDVRQDKIEYDWVSLDHRSLFSAFLVGKGDREPGVQVAIGQNILFSENKFIK